MARTRTKRSPHHQGVGRVCSVPISRWAGFARWVGLGLYENDSIIWGTERGFQGWPTGHWFGEPDGGWCGLVGGDSDVSGVFQFLEFLGCEEDGCADDVIVAVCPFVDGVVTDWVSPSLG